MRRVPLRISLDFNKPTCILQEVPLRISLDFIGFTYILQAGDIDSGTPSSAMPEPRIPPLGLGRPQLWKPRPVHMVIRFYLSIQGFHIVSIPGASTGGFPLLDKPSSLPFWVRQHHFKFGTLGTNPLPYFNLCRIGSRGSSSTKVHHTFHITGWFCTGGGTLW